ncbi:MAG: flagella basal body P-ring formation protein FlgA [Pseudomonadota bacterium]
MPLYPQGLFARLRPAITPLCFAPVAAIMFIPLYAPVFASEKAFAPQNRAGAILDPAEIDRAVTAFTGAGIGEIGGARTAADKRLRLAACAQPLATSWHGTKRSAVRVECGATLGGSAPWRIFVATRPAPLAGGSNASISAAPSAPLVKRGDPITVVVRGRGFSVQQTGEAMGNGRVGDWIAIRTARQAEPVRARIERPGLAVIPIR